ncbi:MAG TPA: IctB family putative bicarbonate transporter, partial [Candidatus Caenarcaniphilales bacterium]
MNLWQQLTLTDLSVYRWRRSSYLWSFVGLLHSWRQGSWLMQWGNEIGVGLLTLLFSVAPFVPNASIGILLVASAGLWFLLTLSEEADSPSNLTPIHLLVLLYWAIATVATALSPVKAAALVGWVKLTLYLVIFALVSRVVRSPRWRAWLITIYLLVALVVSVHGLRQWVFGAEALATWVDAESPLANTTRVYSYLGNPNLLAGYLLPAVPLSLAACFAWRGWLPKTLALTLTFVNTACLVLTFSRGGWIGLVVTVLVSSLLLLLWWSPHLPARWRQWAIPFVLASLVALLLAAVVLVEPLRDRVLSIFADRKDSSNNFRLNVWTAVLEMIRDRPILGIGPGNNAFNQIYPLYQRPRFTALSAYSIFLEIPVETGLLGLGCFFWLLLVTLQQGWTQLKQLRQRRSQESWWLMAAIA